VPRPLLLDLFCGAGGAAVGYHRAGFDVVGVDIKPQPHYPFDFEQAEVLDFMRDGVAGWYFTVAAIHASPPCQAYSTTKTLHTAKYPALISEVRGLLRATGLPYVIENVVGAPLNNPIRLCGSSFGLGVRRHRLFETNWMVMASPCVHPWQPEPIDVTGTGARRIGNRLDGKGGNSRKPRNLDEGRASMGYDWMTRDELSEAIPSAYTKFIGEQLLERLSLTSDSPHSHEAG
jgi:DNA (cytosine-5)-methyltransferase 1